MFWYTNLALALILWLAAQRLWPAAWSPTNAPGTPIILMTLAFISLCLGTAVPAIDEEYPTARQRDWRDHHPGWAANQALKCIGVRRRGALYLIMWLVAGLAFCLRGAVTGGFIRAVLPGPHGRTHSLLALALAWTFGILLGPFALPFALGWTVHLVTDAATPYGIRFWWPFRARRAYLLPRGHAIERGSIVESGLFIAASLAFWLLVLLGAMG